MCIDCEYCGKSIYFSERFLHFGKETGIKVFYISHMELSSVHINEHKDTIYLTFKDVKEEIND